MRLGVSGVLLGFAVTAAAQAPPVRISSGVMAAQSVRRVMPQFPPEAARAGVNGAVVLHVLIGEDGLVLEVTPVSGPEMLRAAYMDAVRQWVYRPYLLNGRPVPVETTVTVSIQMGAPPLPTGRVYVSSGEMAGQILTRTSPLFPPGSADGQRGGGAVVLHAVIGRDGLVKELTVVSGPEFERQPVLDAVWQWTYRPHVVNGEVVEVDTTITMNISFGG